MNPADISNRLSQIQTRWTVVFTAHQEGDAAARAQSELAQRYLGAIYRYILGTVHDPHRADDLAQEFAVRLVRGDFRKATPERGRFRDFVKTAVRNMITDDLRKKRPHQLDSDYPEPAAPQETVVGSDETFLERWREELISRAWEGLAVVEAETGQPYHTVLRQKASNPQLRSSQIAQQLSQERGKPINEVTVRKMVQRSREKFADLLLEEVGRSIQSTSRQEIEEELIVLGLYEYCKPALERTDRP
jgi:RNA polymerase sigma-70 factor (ECF subfamily)